MTTRAGKAALAREAVLAAARSGQKVVYVIRQGKPDEARMRELLIDAGAVAESDSCYTFSSGGAVEIRAYTEDKQRCEAISRHATLWASCPPNQEYTELDGVRINRGETVWFERRGGKWIEMRRWIDYRVPEFTAELRDLLAKWKPRDGAEWPSR